MTSAYKTQRALEESIKSWEARLAATKRGEHISIGVSSCPLCQIFNRIEVPRENRCVGCPVRKRTGRQFCIDTPYDDLERLQNDLVLKVNPAPTQAAIVEAVENEVEFLKSLENEQ